MTDAVLAISIGRARKSVRLTDYLDGEAEERAQREAIAWIKSLRSLEVDGVPFRRRFTHRGDSLWWFTELYLHKQQAVLTIFRGLAAIDALVGREAPHALELERGGPVLAAVVSAAARARRIELHGTATPRTGMRIAAIHARARWLHLCALAARARTPIATPRRNPGAIAAFVHRAFLRRSSLPAIPAGPAAAHIESVETYIGPVLDAIERAGGALDYVTLGPAENFSARRWWHALRSSSPVAQPIEAFAPLARLEAARGLWSGRRTHLRAIWRSAAVREAAVVQGCDLWPLIREQLAGVVLLQWPWSARAMDEAGAALDVIQPSAALTYAEAGGWGRALVLECRRRGIPSAGLQHGFIYRHWLNYLHEPDEMLADPGNPFDRGFPRPVTTLLFDEYARAHLIAAGAFPAESLEVTGSPRLDALAASAAALTAAEIHAARTAAGAANASLVLVVTKFREAGRILPALVHAAAALPDVRLAIKTHPAETPDLYNAVVNGRPATVLPASVPLAPLLLASRAVVTVNSTVALDAAVLGVPALVVGLPNNLSPFVKAGVLAGATVADTPGMLRRILYDEEFRQEIETNRKAFLSRYRIGADGGAADRSARAILARARRHV